MQPRLSAKLPAPSRLAIGLASHRASTSSLAARRLRAVAPAPACTIADPRALLSPVTSLARRAAWRTDGRSIVLAAASHSILGPRTCSINCGPQSGIASRTMTDPHPRRPVPSSAIPSSRRLLHSSPVARHGGINRPKPGEGISVTFRKANGEEKTVAGNEGDDMVDLSWEYDLDIEAACEKSIACSTCHVILTPEVYDQLPEPEDEENDMLDLAFGLQETSRLGCQVKLAPFMNGTTITLPSATRNMAVDGHKASH